MVELRGCAAAVKLCLLLLLMVVGCMSVPLEAKLASDRLKDIDFSCTPKLLLSILNIWTFYFLHNIM